MDVKDFLPQLRKMIQGPLQAAMVDDLLLSTISFCKEARVLREVVDAGDVNSGDVITLSSATADLKVWGVASVFNKDGELSRDQDYKQDERDKITFLDKAAGVKIKIWTHPTDKAKIPDQLGEHDYSICAGAAKTLFLEHGRQWFNGDLSSYYSRIYTEGFRKARREVESDQFGEFQNPTVNNSYWY